MRVLRVIFAWEFPPFEMASLAQTDGKSNLEFWVPGSSPEEGCLVGLLRIPAPS